jgi:hypothetical protein
MKSTQKVTRVKLNIEQNTDYILLGIVTAEPDYKLSLALNKIFGISLRNRLPLKLASEDLSFSRFSNSVDPENLIFNLISNRSGKNFLLSKLKNIDYLLQISDPETEIDLNKITSALRDAETINAVFNIDINTLKDKNLHFLTQ